MKIQAHVPVKAKVISAGVKDGAAVTRIEIEGASADEVKSMFLEEDPGAFFPGASSYMAHSTPNGGRAYLENPVGGPPVMYTHIDPTDEGIKGSFTGLMKGQAPLRIEQQQGKTVVTETGTRVHPNLAWIPGQALAEAVPVLGAIPRVARQAMEGVLGSGLALLHAALVAHDDGQAMAATLERRKQERAGITG